MPAASIATPAGKSLQRVSAITAGNSAFTISRQIPANNIARSWRWSPAPPLRLVAHPIARQGVEAFPAHVVDDVYFCGFTSEASFGAWSYLIVRPPERGGNVLVDSPRFTNPLVQRIELMGGVNLMYLSHRDDIADHAKFAAHFHCPRMMHDGDNASALGIERVTTGTEPVRIDDDLLSIPTAGHTRGHQVLLYRNKIMFTGDHLAWSPARNTLTAFRDACWYSWKEQTRSMEKLLGYRLEWVLPGHGRIHNGSAEEMHEHLKRCVAMMKIS
jgi:glyoxylase-like metal-dependent hydrolase (beta-lactamase superfamily II)